jgi:hypothetical protein
MIDSERSKTMAKPPPCVRRTGVAGSRRGFLLGMAASALPLSVFAHTNDALKTVIGPNGGQVRATLALHLELVVRPTEVAVYVADHDDKRLSTRGATGHVVLLLGAERTEAKLEPFGENGLRATGRFPVDPRLRVVVSVTLSGGKAQQERFEPFNPKVTAAANSAAGSSR